MQHLCQSGATGAIQNSKESNTKLKWIDVTKRDRTRGGLVKKRYDDAVGSRKARRGETRRRNTSKKPTPKGSLKILDTLTEVYEIDYYSSEESHLNESRYDIPKLFTVFKYLLKWENRDKNRQLIREFSKCIALQIEKLSYVPIQVLRLTNECQFCTVLFEEKSNSYVIDKFVHLIEIYKALSEADTTKLVKLSWANIFQIILFFKFQNNLLAIVFPNETIRNLIEPNTSIWRNPDCTSYLRNVKLEKQLVWFNMQLLSNLQNQVEPTTLALLTLYNDSKLLSMYFKST